MYSIDLEHVLPQGKIVFYFHVCKNAQNIAKLKTINILTSLSKMSEKKSKIAEYYSIKFLASLG